MSLSALFGKNYFANVTWFVFISTLTLATKIYSIVCYFVVYSNKLTEIFYQFWTKTTNTLTNQIRLVPVWVFPLTSLNRCSIQFIKSVAWTRANLSAMAYNNIWMCYFFCSERRIYIYFFHAKHKNIIHMLCWPEHDLRNRFPYWYGLAWISVVRSGDCSHTAESEQFRGIDSW